MYKRFHGKYLLFSSNYNQTRYSRQAFLKILKYQVSWKCPREPEFLHDHRQTYGHDETNRLSFFRNLTSSTYWLKMRRVTVAPDHTQWHRPHSVGLLWASDRPVAETNLIVAFYNSANSPTNHHLSRSAACIIYHHVMRSPLIAIGGRCLQMCMLGVNILYRTNR